MDDVQEFYAQATPPVDLDKKRVAFQRFVSIQQAKKRRVVLVTVAFLPNTLFLPVFTNIFCHVCPL